MAEEKGKITLSGEIVDIQKSPKGFIIAVLCGAAIAKFFTDDPTPYPEGKFIKIEVSGSTDGWMGFVK